MKITVLAWGSLFWNRGSLAVASDFEALGPRLPIEFCRISGDGRLTLAIDESFGTCCATYSAVSSFDNLSAAIENLRTREGMPSAKGVGFVDLISGTRSGRALERHPRAVGTINTWARLNRYDAAIWTALASNFREPQKANEPFSVNAAIRYLETRDAKTLSCALTYIRNAPPEVQTPCARRSIYAGQEIEPMVGARSKRPVSCELPIRRSCCRPIHRPRKWRQRARGCGAK